MKRNIKEALEYTLLCACAIGVVFHLNSKLSPKTLPDAQPQKSKTELIDSVWADTMQNVQKMWVLSENIKSR